MKDYESMKILHKNNFGEIAKCNCCKEIQLTLGNVIVVFSEKEYREFDAFFDEIRSDFAFEKDNEDLKRKYIIKTNRNGLTLLLTYQELKDTIELMNFTNVMLSVNQLTSFSEN